MLLCFDLNCLLLICKYSLIAFHFIIYFDSQLNSNLSCRFGLFIVVVLFQRVSEFGPSDSSLRSDHHFQLVTLICFFIDFIFFLNHHLQWIACDIVGFPFQFVFLSQHSFHRFTFLFLIHHVQLLVSHSIQVRLTFSFRSSVLAYFLHSIHFQPMYTLDSSCRLINPFASCLLFFFDLLSVFFFIFLHSSSFSSSLSSFFATLLRSLFYGVFAHVF